MEELVNLVVCIPDAFRIRIDNQTYIFSMDSKDQQTKDYFAVSAIYDTIIDLDKKIKYSFSEAIAFDLPETLEGYHPFLEPAKNESVAMYYIENMVYRVSILWDLLAQLCNIMFHTGIDVNKVYYTRYFELFSKGKNSIEIAKEIKAYLDEVDIPDANDNQWQGNHAFLNAFRNQMTHRVTPSITSISSFGFSLRPPAMYLLHRTTEDYYKVSSFLCKLINDFLEEYESWRPFSSLNRVSDVDR